MYLYFPLRFDPLDILIPNEDARNISFSVWDLGQDIAASQDVLGLQTWQCELSFSLNVPVQMLGSTTAVISAEGTSPSSICFPWYQPMPRFGTPQPTRTT